MTVNKVKCLNERRCHVLADVIIFVFEVPCIFWRYINVDEVSLHDEIHRDLKS